MADRRMEVIKKDNADFEFTFKDVDGELINLTGSTVFFTVKRNKNDLDDDALIKKDITDFTGMSLGTVLLELSSSDTDMLAGSYFFDVQVKYPNNKIASSEAGRFIVKQDITNRTTIDND